MNATVIRYIRQRRMAKVDLKPAPEPMEGGGLSRRLSRTASVHESLYSNRTSFLRRTMRRMGGLEGKVKVKEEEMKKMAVLQAKRAGQMLVRHPSTRAGMNADANRQVEP